MKFRQSGERGRDRARRLFPPVRDGDELPPAGARRPVPRLRRRGSGDRRRDLPAAPPRRITRDDALRPLRQFAAISPSASACRARAASAAASWSSRRAMARSPSGRRGSTPGTSLAGAAALEKLVEQTGWSVFFDRSIHARAFNGSARQRFRLLTRLERWRGAARGRRRDRTAAGAHPVRLHRQLPLHLPGLLDRAGQLSGGAGGAVAADRASRSTSTCSATG